MAAMFDTHSLIAEYKRLWMEANTWNPHRTKHSVYMALAHVSMKLASRLGIDSSDTDQMMASLRKRFDNSATEEECNDTETRN